MRTDGENDVFLQAQEDAERCGYAFAETALELFSDDETKLGNFVDKLFDFYYVSDNRQFIDFLILLGDVYGIPLSPEVKTYRTDDGKADALYLILFRHFLLRSSGHCGRCGLVVICTWYYIFVFLLIRK